MWRIMAERMAASWTSAPHFYLVREVDVSRLVTWRERASKQSGARITYTDLLVRLVAAAVAQHPRVNVSWKDGAIVQHADVNIGLAVAIDDGLVVPVLHRADTLSLAEIAQRREDLVARAQAGKLRPADIQGAGFTISNLGAIGGTYSTPIISYPEVAILLVGRARKLPIVTEGDKVEVRLMLPMSLSYDHRLVDGREAVTFLVRVKEAIEDPTRLLIDL